MSLKPDNKQNGAVVLSAPLSGTSNGFRAKWLMIGTAALIAAALFGVIYWRRGVRGLESTMMVNESITSTPSALSPWKERVSKNRRNELLAATISWLIFGVRSILLLCVVSAIVYYVIAFVAGLLWFSDRRRQRALGQGFTPPATIFKPVRGADAHAYENFASFCRQQYAEYQIIFGVQDADDPVVSIINRVIADFPDHDIEIVISADKIGAYAKVSNLQNMYLRAKHDILLIVDSDIRVTPDYLGRVISPMQRERTGMVTCLYRGVNATTFAGLIENIGISSTFAPEVCTSRALEGIAFALGSTIVMRRSLLEKIGGFPAIADYLADDFLLGNYAAREGYEVVLSDYVVEHVSALDTLRSMLKHQLRWGRSTRISRPWGYRGLILTYGTATALLSLAAWNFTRIAWLVLAATMIVRFMPVFLVGVYGLKDQTLARYFWLTPIRDLITFAIWMFSFVGDEIEWRGVRFRVLPNGQIESANVPLPQSLTIHSTAQ